jgi:hypothetical protein
MDAPGTGALLDEFEATGVGEVFFYNIISAMKSLETKNIPESSLRDLEAEPSSATSLLA